MEPDPASAHPCFTEGDIEAVGSQSRLSLPRLETLPSLRALLLAGAVGPPGTHRGLRGNLGAHRGRQRHRQAWASDLGSGSLGPPVVPSSQPPSPPLPVSPKAGRSQRPSSCPRSPEAPWLATQLAMLVGGGPGCKGQPREDGGFCGRPREEGRKGASDAHHVCGIEYD